MPRFMSPKPKIELITSFDDYNEDNYLVAEILKRFDIPAIWFIECKGLSAMEQIKEFDDMGFEIGSHTIDHTYLNPCPLDLQKYEIFESKKALETLLQKSVRWFAYPRGRYSKDTKQLVKKAGYIYARTTRLVDNLAKYSGDNYSLPTSCHCFPRSEYGGVDWADVFKAKIDYGKIHLWGHAKELINQGELGKLENLFRWVKQNYELIYS
jgi:peptidoglycan/xylan/chitin deacetylase (PgdA/CDA1 family)